jgi:NAD+ synthase (glutamine-hydrolysing)
MHPGKSGFVRIAAAVPTVKVTAFEYNREQTLSLWRQAHQEGCAVAFFPELGITAYTAGDLHMDQHLLEAARHSLGWLLEQGEKEGLSTLAFVGLPLFVHPGVYNCAAAIQGGRLLGIVPKGFLPTYGEFYEKRQFREGRHVPPGTEIDVCGRRVPFGMDLLFAAENVPELVVGVEICEDGWAHLSPNAYQVSSGATVCGNLSGSNFLLGKAETRRMLCWKASGPGKCAFVYTGSGPGESSSDLAFDSHALIYENGWLLAESRRFSRASQLIAADVDLELLIHERVTSGTFGDCAEQHSQHPRRVAFTAYLPETFRPLRRPVERHPFVPKDVATLATRCWEVFEIQTNALITRMEHFGNDKLVLALSGGRDSTLAALACANALDQMGKPRANLTCVSMPGLGTSTQTRAASRRLATALGATFEEEDIREESYLILREQGHRSARRYKQWLEENGCEHNPDTFTSFLSQHSEVADVELENIQARIRKLRVLTKANRHRAVEIGTGDLSEKALGWSTYAGDHISMYDMNCGIPKTLVEFVIRWVATERISTWSFDSQAQGEELEQALFDVLEAPISPELLPTGAEGRIAQLTEHTLGPYELHDFFLYWFVRHGTRPARILFLAEAAFEGEYAREEIRKWLLVFFRRFFFNQWKRDCTPNGPKVGAVALSPRGDWRMPSDAVVQSWLEEVENDAP